MYSIKTLELLNSFNSPYEAARAVFPTKNHNTVSARIYKICTDNAGQAYGYLWRYESDNLNLVVQDKPAKAKTVLQFSINGDFIAEFESIAAYTRSVSSDYITQRKMAKTISDCCRGQCKTAYGFK